MDSHPQNITTADDLARNEVRIATRGRPEPDRDLSPLQLSLHQTEENLAALADEVTRLEVRLSGVLSPSVPDDGSYPADPSNGLAPVVQAIDQHNARLRSIIASVRMITERLEV